MNGRVVPSREETQGTNDLTLKETVRVPGSCWLAARCASRVEPTRSLRVAAHTSPVYVGVRGEELFSPPVAAFLLTLIDGSEAWVKHLPIRPDPQRLAGALKVFA